MPFDMTFTDLPKTLPIFPLPRVILLPRVSLPLNIFEKRYLAMIDDAFKSQKLIGMIQTKSEGTLYQTGCAGRIVSYTETDDGRYEVTLKGVCRFDIDTELGVTKGGYRHVIPDWTPYAHDLTPEEGDMGIFKEALSQTLREYFDKTGLFCDQWDHIKEMCCDRLVSTLSVVCPLEPMEKQSLVEAQTLSDRAHLLKQHLETASLRATEKTKATICH